MRLLAKVYSDSPLSPIRSGGEEFIKAEWRPVRAGAEAEAERNPYLMTRLEEPAEDLQAAAGSSGLPNDDPAAQAQAPAASEPETRGEPADDEPQAADTDPAAEPVTITPADGINDTEASAAGAALAQRAHEKAGDAEPAKARKGRSQKGK